MRDRVIRPLKYACSFGLLLAITAGCSTGSTTATTTTASAGIPTTTVVSTTTLAGTIGPGKAQTATGPSGQMVTGTPTTLNISARWWAVPKAPGSLDWSW